MARRIDIEERGDVIIVTLKDEKIWKEQQIQETGEQLFGLVDELQREKVILDCRNVSYMSSAMLGKMITLHEKIQTQIKGMGLVICELANEPGCQRDICSVFEVAGLDKFFTKVYPQNPNNVGQTLQEALQFFTS